MRQGTLSLSLVMLLIALPLHAEEQSPPPAPADGQEFDLNEEAPTAPAAQPQASEQERTLAQLTRLRQENQRLKLQLKEAQAEQLPPLLSERQLWFIIGSGVVLVSFVLGALLRGRRKSRR